jgi:cytochrome c oxidase subunit 1
MTISAARPRSTPAAGHGDRSDGVQALDRRPGGRVVGLLTTTDHKIIGNLYLATSFGFFLLGGLLALGIRAELAAPGLQVVDNAEQFNQLFTMHGTIMLLLFATPLFAGFANALVPLQIGSPDVAFPAAEHAGLLALRVRRAGRRQRLPDPGRSGCVRLVRLRATVDRGIQPGSGRRPVGVWARAHGIRDDPGCGQLHHDDPHHARARDDDVPYAAIHLDRAGDVGHGLVIFPVLAAAFFALGADRRFGAHIFDAEAGGAMLWQHLFWFFGHPEVYVMALPFFGIISEVVPVFSRKPIFGYKTPDRFDDRDHGSVVAVWAHHMYATGQVLLPFFAIMTMLIAVPTGVKFFNWIGTMWGGSVTLATPMIWAMGFLDHVPVRRDHRGDPGQPGPGLPRLR